MRQHTTQRLGRSLSLASFRNLRIGGQAARLICTAKAPNSDANTPPMALMGFPFVAYLRDTGSYLEELPWRDIP